MVATLETIKNVRKPDDLPIVYKQVAAVKQLLADQTTGGQQQSENLSRSPMRAVTGQARSHVQSSASLPKRSLVKNSSSLHNALLQSGRSPRRS